MDRSLSSLFRPAAVEAASGTQVGAILATHWRGVPAFAVVALLLLAAFVAYLMLVDVAPVHRVAAFVETRGGPVTSAPRDDDRLVVRLPIAPAVAASVRPGADLSLAFRAYPPQRFGLFPARIERVDEVRALAGEAPPGGGREPRFVAVAALPSALHGPQGEPLPLEPGMSADALVPTARRSVFAWLVGAIRRGANDGVGRAPHGTAAVAGEPRR